jgi:hypothetical protein
MTDLPPTPTSTAPPRVGPDRASAPRTPRWVKVFGMIAAMALVLLVILHLTGLVGMAGHH